MPRPTRSCLVLLAFLSACSGSTPPESDAGITLPDDGGHDAGVMADGGDTGDAGVGPEVAYCADLCAHQTGCAPNDTHDACDTARCTARAVLYREGVREDLLSCLTTDCAANEDACFTGAAQSAGTRPADDAFRTECTARRTACANAFTAGICAPTNGTELFVESAVEAARDCLARECDEVVGCFLGALGGPK